MSQEKPQQQTKFRWRIVGILLCSIFGVMGVIFALGSMVAMAYVNMKYGWVEYSHGRNETRDQVAITATNIARSVIYLLAGVAFLIAARQWHHQRKRRGSIWTAIGFGLMGVANALNPPH